MTAPAIIDYPDPVGRKMDDGFAAFLAFDLDDTVSLWIIGAQPPSLDGGGPIDTTTNSNQTVETMAPQALIKIGESKLSCAWEPGAYKQIMAMINKNQNMTFHFPDIAESTYSFYGVIQNFVPAEFKKGTRPEASLTIYATNTDPLTGAEEPPVMTGAIGT